MIFVTIGSQEPFDRLIKVIDNIALSIGDIEIVAQVASSKYKAKNIKTLAFVTPDEFKNYFTKAKLIISHAGMGTIISALQQEKPIIVVPRLAKYRETRNDHQVATSIAFEKLNQIYVAYSEDELQQRLLSVLSGDLQPLHKIGNYASKELIKSIQDFIHTKH